MLCSSSNCKHTCCLCIFQLLHRNIDCIEKRLEATRGSIIIKCKNFQILRLDVPGQEETLNVAGSIEALSTLGMFIALPLNDVKSL